jgi:hypothetical protein
MIEMKLISASSLFRKLQNEDNIDQSAIKADHIQDVYQNLKSIDQTADFSAIDGVLEPKEIDPNMVDAVHGVIIETRQHPLLENVITNVIETTQLPIQLFHGTDNLEFILQSKLSNYIEEGKVSLNCLQTSALNANQYNALLLSPVFWHSLVGRKKILIFQTDSLCCSDTDYALCQFMAFDYIGGSWNPERPNGLIVEAGSGGFSLRDWTASLDCLARFPAEQWQGGEDGYFAFHMELIGYKVANLKESAKFVTQDQFNYRSFATHSPHLLNEESRANFIQYCPEASSLLNEAAQ